MALIKTTATVANLNRGFMIFGFKWVYWKIFEL